MNTGEGGLSPYHLEGGADIVFQIGTAKYGVRDEDGNLSDEKLRAVAAHDCVKMFEIKLSQGAKPGKGGILPGAKVTPEIAAIRGISVGEDSISPNRHSEVISTGTLLDLIDRIRNVTGKPVGFKTVVGDVAWIEQRGEEQDEALGSVFPGEEILKDFAAVEGVARCAEPPSKGVETGFDRKCWWRSFE